MKERKRSRAAMMLLPAVFLLALAWRWAYLARLGATPFAEGLNADSRIYWVWSDYILRHGLAPPSAFFLAPLYPYALAAMRAVGASTVSQVLLAQALLGAVAVVLVADAARRIAGWSAGLVAGGLLAFFGPATFFDGLVLPESLLFFLESLLVWYVARFDWPRARLGCFAGYGLLVGVLAQGRASEAVLLLLVIPLAWGAAAQPPGTRASAVQARGRQFRRTLAAIGVSFGMFAVCTLPSLLANLGASGEPIPFTYNLGFNLYVGNNPDADGGYVDVTGGSIPVPLEGTSPITGGALDGRAFLCSSEGVSLSPAASSARWADEAMAFVRSSPWKALGLAGRKLLLAVNRRESPQIESMQSFRRAAGPLGIPLAGSFGFLAVLGLSGFAWAARTGLRGRWLAGYVALLTLAMTPFFVTDRYRHHLVPALAVLAGLSLAALARAVRDVWDARAVRGAWDARGAGAAHAPRAGKRRGRLPAAIAPALGSALAVALVLAPLEPSQARHGDWGFVADQAMRLLERGAYPQAVTEFARAENELGDVRLGRPEALSAGARVDLAAFYLRYGIALEAVGREAEALTRWERAAALDPNDVTTLGRLSVAYERSGRTADAARVRAMLRAVPGGGGQLFLNDGWAAAARGDLAGAEKLFLEAVQAAPDLSMAWEGLIRVRIQTGRLEEAWRALDRARGAGLEPGAAVIFESYLDLQRGDPAAARRALLRLPPGAASSDAYLAGLLDYCRARLARP